MILILADRTDPWADLVYQELLYRGSKVAFVENSQILSSLGINWRVDNHSVLERNYLTVDAQKIHFVDLTGVLAHIRYPICSPYSRAMNQADQEYVGKEAYATFLGLLNALPCPVVNRPIPGGQSRCLFTDSFQRDLARQYGFLLPEGLVTSCRKEMIRWVDRWGSGVRVLARGTKNHERIIKGREGVAHLGELMSHQVVALQGIPQGQFISVFTIGDSAIGSIESQENLGLVDYQPMLYRFDLSFELKKRCCRLAQALQLEFSQMRLLQGKDGDVYCFDVNGVPVFDRCDATVQKEIVMLLGAYLEQGKRKITDDSFIWDHSRSYHGQRVCTAISPRL